jgi:hypothetical protein
LFGLEVGDAILAQRLDGFQSFCISLTNKEISSMPLCLKDRKKGEPCCLKDVIEFLLQSGRLGQRPVRFFLVTENYIFEHRFGYSKKMGYLSVHLGAFRRDHAPLVKFL